MAHALPIVIICVGKSAARSAMAFFGRVTLGCRGFRSKLICRAFIKIRSETRLHLSFFGK